MKQISKAFFFLAIATLSSLTISAQRYAYVDTDYILKNLDSYQDAQAELDRISTQWQKEIEQRYEAIDRLYKAYQAEKVLLTEDMRKEREDEIVRQEGEAKALQRQRFGVDGDLFRRREELIQPIQEEVFQAIKQVADGGGFSVMFDKAGQSNILYADPRYDKSDRVLSRLGVSASDRDDDDSDQDSGGATDTSPSDSNGGQSPRR
ncbi:MAG: OmpH family outer membrane protein [Cryomorphaceae bacterium]